MKIICIGRNYVDHAKELKNVVPKKPLIFIKPETAILKSGETFHYPDFSKDIHYEAELVFEINKYCKNFSKKQARESISKIGLGIDFTARDLQSELKENSHPWEIAKGFDQSAAVSHLIDISHVDLEELEFELFLNKNRVQKGSPKQMVFDIYKIISYASKYFTLEPGDLIFSGTPKGVGPVNKKDHLEGHINGKKVLNIDIR